MTTPQTHYRNATVQGLNIAYREAGNPGSPNSPCCTDFPHRLISIAI